MLSRANFENRCLKAIKPSVLEGGCCPAEDPAGPESEWHAGQGGSGFDSSIFTCEALTGSSCKLVFKTCESRPNWQYKISVLEAPSVLLSFLVWDYVSTRPFQVKSKLKKDGSSGTRAELGGFKFKTG